MKKLPLAVLILSASSLFIASAQAQVIVIANPSVKATSISKSDLREVFTGGTPTLKDGSSVTPVLLKQGHTHEEFLKTYVGKDDSALRTTWRSLVFSGQASMPKSLESEAAVVEYVSHTAGAVGYISKATAHDGVKLVDIQ